MKKNNLVLLLVVLVLAIGGFMYFKSQEQPMAPMEPAAPEKQPAAKEQRDTLVVADQYDATTFDPVRHNDYPSSRACHQVYDTLIFLNDDGTFRPGLAEKWEFVSDTAYKMYLRKGVKFHNGEELKAEDVKFSLERATTDLGAHIKTYSQDLDSVEVLDDYTVVLHLKKVNFPFFASLAHSWGSIVNKKEVEAQGENYGTPAGTAVGTGPFKFLSWQKSDRYTLERFDDYWGEKVKFKTLVLRSIPEPTARTVGLETGEVDIAYPIINNDISRIEENEALVLQRKPLASTTYMGFNTTKKPFDDPRVRNAFSAALDTVGIQKAVFRGVGKTPRTLIPSGIKYSIDAELPAHARDVEAAKKLFAEAGVDPKELKIQIWTNERKERVDMATIIHSQLQELGIDAEIKVLEWGAYIQGLQSKEHDLFLLGWGLSVPDPDYAVAGLLETGAGTNYTFFSDAKLDELLAKGRAMPDGPDREKAYKDMQLYINEMCPMILLHNDESLVGVQKTVKGFVSNPFDVHTFATAYFEE